MAKEKSAKVKYYFTGRAGMPIRAGENQYQFERLYSVGGSMYGVYRAEEEEQQKELDALVETKKLNSITEKEYNAQLKKKDSSLNLSTVRVVEGNRPIPPKAAPPASNDKSDGSSDTPPPADTGKDHSSDEAESGEKVEGKAATKEGNKGRKK